jgi:hypothetical protein
VPDAVFFAQRQAEIEHLQSYYLPDLLHRFDDLEPSAGAPGQRPGCRGQPDRRGSVGGPALMNPAPLAPGFTAEEYLVACPVDAG